MKIKGRSEDQVGRDLNYPISHGDRRAGTAEVISPDASLYNNNTTMAPIPLTKEKSLGTDELPVSEHQKSRTSRRAIMPFIVTTLLVLVYYFTTPILSACSHRHKRLTIEERATKILSENPLIGT